MHGDAQQHLMEPSDGLIMPGMSHPQLRHPPGGLLVVPGPGAGNVPLVVHLVAW